MCSAPRPRVHENRMLLVHYNRSRWCAQLEARTQVLVSVPGATQHALYLQLAPLPPPPLQDDGWKQMLDLVAFYKENAAILR